MKKKIVEYTIWLAWDKPIVGACFPPGDEKPHSLNQVVNWDPNYVQLIENGDTRLGTNVWAHVGSPKDFNAMVFYQKHHAEMWTSRLPGSYIETRESK